MKVRILAIGAVLMIIGFVVFWYGYSFIQFTTGRILTPQGQVVYIQALIMTLLGGILAISGLVVLVYGAAAKSKQ